MPSTHDEQALTDAEATVPPTVPAIVEAIATLRAKWPALGPDEQAAFFSLVTDAACDEMGTRTKANDVLREGLRWAVQIDDQIRHYPQALESYSPERYSYFLGCLAGLATAISREDAKQTQTTSVRSDAALAREQALAVRIALTHRLMTFAGSRPQEREALTQATGTTDTDDHLVRSLHDLARLGGEWLARTDKPSRFLVSQANLSQLQLDIATQAATALTSGSVSATLGGPALAHDSPAVNRVEGRVVLEMKEAMRLVNAAHDANAVIRRLSPGPATRHVLGSKRRGKTQGDEDEDETSTAAEGTTTAAPNASTHASTAPAPGAASPAQAK